MDVPVYMEEPIDKPEEYFIIQKTSSSNSNMHTSVVMAIQSYGKTLLNACKLNEKLKDTMPLFINDEHVSKVKLNTDYNYTDTQKKKYRYQAIYQIDLF